MEYGRPELAHVGGPLPVGSGFYPRVGGGAGNMMFDEVQHAALVVEMLSSLAPHEVRYKCSPVHSISALQVYCYLSSLSFPRPLRKGRGRQRYRCTPAPYHTMVVLGIPVA